MNFKSKKGKNMNIITTILRAAIGIIVMMFRIGFAAAGGGGGSSSSGTSSSSGSGTNTNCIPREVKIGDVWYCNISEKSNGEVEIRKGMGDSVEYVARKPNPVLHPNYYFYCVNLP